MTSEWMPAREHTFTGPLGRCLTMVADLECEHEEQGWERPVNALHWLTESGQWQYTPIMGRVDEMLAVLAHTFTSSTGRFHLERLYREVPMFHVVMFAQWEHDDRDLVAKFRGDNPGRDVELEDIPGAFETRLGMGLFTGDDGQDTPVIIRRQRFQPAMIRVGVRSGENWGPIFTSLARIHVAAQAMALEGDGQ